MTDQKVHKVLRIGIFKDGVNLQERFINAETSVTVGHSSKCTFEFPGFEAEEFTLFNYTNGGYKLQLSDAVKGMVAKGTGAKVPLDPSNAPEEGFVTLTDTDRGKVHVGEFLVLFQFVTPPPVQAAVPLEDLDFRPKFFQEDDGVMLVSLGMWTALGVIFAFWVMTSEKPEIDMGQMEKVYERLAIVEPPEPDTTADEDDEDEEEEDDRPKVATEKKPEKVEPKEAPKAPEEMTREEKVEQAQKVADEKAKIQEELAKSLQMISTLGANKGGTTINVDQMMRGSNEADDEALNEAVALSRKGGKGTRSASGTGTGPAAVGDINTGSVGGGGAPLDGAASAAFSGPKPSVDVGAIDFGGGDASGVKKILSRYKGRLLYCHETGLKRDPSLAGRVTLGWDIEAGSAVGVYVVENSTKDQEFTQCLIKKIKNMKFDGVEEGGVTQTWIFEPSQ